MQVMVFFGREGWRALSPDASGSTLPALHGPWVPYQWAACTDADELAEIAARGFHLLRRREDDA